MKSPRYQCERCRHWHVLAMVIPAGPGTWECMTPCTPVAALVPPGAVAVVRYRPTTGAVTL